MAGIHLAFIGRVEVVGRSNCRHSNDTATNPRCDGGTIADLVDMEDRFAGGLKESSLGCVNPWSRGHAAQFFWDLYEAQNHSAEIDGVNLNCVNEIRMVWRALGGEYCDNEKNENSGFAVCGRNARDYRHRYDQNFSTSIYFPMFDDCMEMQDDPLNCPQNFGPETACP